MSVRHATIVLQRQLDVFPEWLQKLRMVINTKKSKAICFTRKTTTYKTSHSY